MKAVGKGGKFLAQKSHLWKYIEMRGGDCAEHNVAKNTCDNNEAVLVKVCGPSGGVVNRNGRGIRQQHLRFSGCDVIWMGWWWWVVYILQNVLGDNSQTVT